jgi:hypothetical protein
VHFLVLCDMAVVMDNQACAQCVFQIKKITVGSRFLTKGQFFPQPLPKSRNRVDIHIHGSQDRDMFPRRLKFVVNFSINTATGEYSFLVAAQIKK